MTTQTTKYDHREVCREAALSVPIETRQKFINAMWHGMTLGEAAMELDISLEAAMGIMNMNLVRETTLLLNKESV